MKTVIHKANTRGVVNHGWLQANYSFSFAGWFNKERIHFGALRVLNDDVIAPKMGFGMHPHENMEIITIPLKGILKHRDNMDDEWVSVVPGEVQVMSAGTGVQHSEINGSVDENLNLFQIWIIPEKQGVSPRYDQKEFKAEDRKGKLQTLVTSFNNEDEKSLKINQDAKISRIDLKAGETFTYYLISENHGVYIMNISGKITINNNFLETRDAIAISETQDVIIKTQEETEVLFIEVPMVSL
ncbi:pirin family protein [Seonamhaeicola sp.]|uniref:pirin family protein n=1 Tax=Seonamhaeicola sp. TaxID=1912245 RepID=UPI00356595EB